MPDASRLFQPYQLPSTSLPRLFAPKCNVRTLILERTNRTAQFADFHKHTQGKHAGNRTGSDWSQMSAARFATVHDEWFDRVKGLATRSAVLWLTTEQLHAETQTLSHHGGAASQLPSMDALLRHAFGAPASRARASTSVRRSTNSSAIRKAPSSAAGAKAAAKTESTASQRERRRRAVVYTASAAFCVTLVAGMCLALGIAIGQRYGEPSKRAREPGTCGAPDSCKQDDRVELAHGDEPSEGHARSAWTPTATLPTMPFTPASTTAEGMQMQRQPLLAE